MFLHRQRTKYINEFFVSKLLGKDPNTSKNVYSSQNPYTNGVGEFIRNPDCWLNGVSNISCFSPAQLSGASWNQRAGTLVSPRHLIFAAHFTPAVLANGGTPMIFVDDNNNVVRRNLVSTLRVSDYADISIGLLDQDVPNNIKFAKVLPPNYTDLLSINPQNSLLCVSLDQEEKAIVKAAANFSTFGDPYLPTITVYDIDSYVWTANNQPIVIKENYSLLNSFKETIITGDSGNPVFAIINNELVLLTTWWTPNSGTFITSAFDTINTVMNNLGGGYSLSVIDLTQIPVHRMGLKVKNGSFYITK